MKPQPGKNPTSSKYFFTKLSGNVKQGIKWIYMALRKNLQLPTLRYEGNGVFCLLEYNIP